MRSVVQFNRVILDNPHLKYNINPVSWLGNLRMVFYISWHNAAANANPIILIIKDS
jgi:hypothetical protein